MEIKCDTTNFDHPDYGNSKGLQSLLDDIDKLQNYRDYWEEFNFSTEALGYFVYFSYHELSSPNNQQLIAYFTDNRNSGDIDI